MTHRNVWQPFDERCIFGKECLFCDARHFAVDCFARQRVNHLDGFGANGPVNAEIRRLNLVTCFGRCDESEFRFVQVVWRRQTLDDSFDATTNGSS